MSRNLKTKSRMIPLRNRAPFTHVRTRRTDTSTNQRDEVKREAPRDQQSHHLHKRRVIYKNEHQSLSCGQAGLHCNVRVMSDFWWKATLALTELTLKLTVCVRPSEHRRMSGWQSRCFCGFTCLDQSWQNSFVIYVASAQHFDVILEIQNLYWSNINSSDNIIFLTGLFFFLFTQMELNGTETNHYIHLRCVNPEVFKLFDTNDPQIWFLC